MKIFLAIFVHITYRKPSLSRGPRPCQLPALELPTCIYTGERQATCAQYAKADARSFAVDGSLSR
jgi:hypothetical protein